MPTATAKREAKKEVGKLAGKKRTQLQDLYDELLEKRGRKRALNRDILESCDANEEYASKTQKVKELKGRLKEIFLSVRRGDKGIDRELDELSSQIADLEDNVATVALRMWKNGEKVEVEVTNRKGETKRLTPRFKVGFNQGELF